MPLHCTLNNNKGWLDGINLKMKAFFSNVLFCTLVWHLYSLGGLEDEVGPRHALEELSACHEVLVMDRCGGMFDRGCLSDHRLAYLTLAGTECIEFGSLRQLRTYINDYWSTHS